MIIPENGVLDIVEQVPLAINVDRSPASSRSGVNPVALEKGPYAYDDIQRIPLIVAGPGVAKGRVDDAFVYLHDVTRTLLDVGGAAPFDCANAKT